MKNNRRGFLKHAGLVGLSVTSASIVPSCNSGIGTKSTSGKDWRLDPEWREVKYGAWSGPGVPDGPGPMVHVPGAA